MSASVARTGAAREFLDVIYLAPKGECLFADFPDLPLAEQCHYLWSKYS